jgi:hypothetical protein
VSTGFGRDFTSNNFVGTKGVGSGNEAGVADLSFLASLRCASSSSLCRIERRTLVLYRDKMHKLIP